MKKILILGSLLFVSCKDTVYLQTYYEEKLNDPSHRMTDQRYITESWWTHDRQRCVEGRTQYSSTYKTTTIKCEELK